MHSVCYFAFIYLSSYFNLFISSRKIAIMLFYIPSQSDNVKYDYIKLKVIFGILLLDPVDLHQLTM